MEKAIIFDVDGTLVDPKEGVLSAVKYMIKEHELKALSDEVLETFIGPPIQDSLQKIYGMSVDEAQLCANTFRDRYSKIDVFKSSVYDGIFELLDVLLAKNIKMGIATYKRQDYAVSLMQHLGLDKYFTCICGADNENKLKKVDIVRICRDELCENAIMIGDSCHDAKAANELGIDFIGVTYGFGFKSFDDMVEFQPVFCADSVGKLIRYFKNKE